jgi:PAS domain S-box-containing protein
MGEYERLTRDELAATLAGLEAAQLPDSDVLKRALHELQVHQVELEMQNRELRETQQLLEESRDRYAQLYDASPVGYVTLDLAGCLQEVNLSAHRLLAGKRVQVIGRPLIEWVAPSAKPGFLDHMTRCRHGDPRVTTELALKTQRGCHQVELASVPDPQKGKTVPGFLTAIMDISARKAAEEELRQSREKLRQLAFHVEALREADRTRIAREIHDELGAGLTGLKMDLGWCHQAAAAARLDRVADRLAGTIRLADAVIGSIRNICADLRPSMLDNLGMLAALEWLVRSVEEKSGIRCELDTPGGSGDLGLSPDRRTALFRIAQEALSNVARHSGATRARLSLQCDAGGVGLEVRDNGRGFVPGRDAAAPSFGLLGMEERAGVLGGRFRVASAPGQGTTVSVYVPRKQPSP